ncbi:uncharacterized protein Dvar_71870 [Desulfosarcina variabilis str. Montpellier]
MVVFNLLSFEVSKHFSDFQGYPEKDFTHSWLPPQILWKRLLWQTRWEMIPKNGESFKSKFALSIEMIVDIARVFRQV